MFCAISGQTPEDPVVSKQGHVFERRLIEKALQDTGRCPLTDEPMTVEDLISLKTDTTVRPRPTTATSVPGLLAIFQNEWDALMLETFTLKQQLEAARQELSHTLYQHDAACRVIARLLKERDAARAALGDVQANMAAAVKGAPVSAPEAAPAETEDSMEVDKPRGLSNEVVKKMQATSQGLSKLRKKRQPSHDLATSEAIGAYECLESHTPHAASPAGITCVAVHPTQPKLLTGGNDHNLIVFDRSSGTVASKIVGHSKKVNQVLFHPTEDLIFSCSADKTGRVWGTRDDKNKYTPLHTVERHTGDVTGISLHATGDYFVLVSQDKTWSLTDIESGTTLCHIMDPAVSDGFSCGTFHPDGLILGTGTFDSLVRIWDLKSQGNVASFEGHTGTINSITFSENGYYLATAAENFVKLWDLRKLTNFRSITLDEGSAIKSVVFDYSGVYLAIAGPDVRVYHTKTWDVVKTFTDHTAAATGVAFGPNASFIASTSSDRALKVYGLNTGS